jgi:hypothetical protein
MLKGFCQKSIFTYQNLWHLFTTLDFSVYTIQSSLVSLTIYYANFSFSVSQFTTMADMTRYADGREIKLAFVQPSAPPTPITS